MADPERLPVLVWRRIILPVLLLLVLGAASAALVKLAFFPDVVESGPTEPSAGIADPVVGVERGSIANELSLAGNIARDQNVTVRSETNGTITAVHVSEGATVTAGQHLFTIRQDYPVRTIEVYAPEAGEIVQLGVIRGQGVGIGGELLMLSPARYHLLATVQPVQLYRLVGAPTEGTVTITGGPAPFTCTGVRVQVTNEGNASVRCAIPGDQVVFAGLPAQLDLALGQVEDALIIPTTAVKGGAASGIVWVDTGEGEPEERTVTLGINDGFFVEVIEGLTQGEQIRQFVPGFAAPVEQFCWEDGMGGMFCETGNVW